MKHPPIRYLLHCSKFDTKELAKFMGIIPHVVKKNSLCPFNVIIEELLGEHNFNTEDSTTNRFDLERCFHLTKKEI